MEVLLKDSALRPPYQCFLLAFRKALYLYKAVDQGWDRVTNYKFCGKNRQFAE